MKIEKNRLKDPTKTTAVSVTHKPHRRQLQGTPPNTRTTASSGSEIASSSTICSSLLASLPMTIWKLPIGVVMRVPRVRL